MEFRIRGCALHVEAFRVKGFRRLRVMGAGFGFTGLGFGVEGLRLMGSYWESPLVIDWVMGND